MERSQNEQADIAFQPAAGASECFAYARRLPWLNANGMLSRVEALKAAEFWRAVVTDESGALTNLLQVLAKSRIRFCYVERFPYSMKVNPRPATATAAAQAP